MLSVFVDTWALPADMSYVLRFAATVGASPFGETYLPKMPLSPGSSRRDVPVYAPLFDPKFAEDLFGYLIICLPYIFKMRSAVRGCHHSVPAG